MRLKPLLEFVFLSDWFYDDKNIGNLVKSPVDFLTGLNRQFYISYQNPDVLDAVSAHTGAGIIQAAKCCRLAGRPQLDR